MGEVIARLNLIILDRLEEGKGAILFVQSATFTTESSLYVRKNNVSMIQSLV
jgi:hypothetical protein